MEEIKMTIEQIIDAIKEMKVLELNELVKKAEEEVDLSKHNLFERRKALDKWRKTRNYI